MSDDEKTLICCRCKDMPEPNTDGSLKNRCGTCGEAVWVSEAGQKMVAQGTKILCGQCIEKVLQGENKPQVQVPLEVIQESVGQMLIDAERQGAKPRNVYQFMKKILDLPRK